MRVQIGVRQVIAGWDEGILGDGKDVPPMKVRASPAFRPTTSSSPAMAISTAMA